MAPSPRQVGPAGAVVSRPALAADDVADHQCEQDRAAAHRGMDGPEHSRGLASGWCAVTYAAVADVSTVAGERQRSCPAAVRVRCRSALILLKGE
jgi:hypothetical protein